MPEKLLKKLEITRIIDAIGDPVSIQDTNFRILYQNAPHKEIVGERAGEFCYRAYQGKEEKCDGCHLEMCFRDGMIHTVERNRIAGDSISYTENTASPVRDSSGNIIAGIEVVRDITERKLSEKRLMEAIARAEEEKAKSESVIQSIGDSLIIVGIDYKILYENEHMKNISGEGVGQYCYRAHSRREEVCEDCTLPLTFRNGGIHTSYKTKESEHGLRYILSTTSPLRDSSGRIVGGLVLGKDMTDQKLAEEALKKAHDELEIRVRQRTRELEESNTALKVLIKQRENDRKELENNILSSIKYLVHPYIEKLKSRKSMSEDIMYLNIIESNLKEIVSPFSSRLSFQYLNLTPKEILVANLIKDGKQDKDIIQIMNISPETVKSHRQNIRKKLGIYGKRSNLRTKLLSLYK